MNIRPTSWLRSLVVALTLLIFAGALPAQAEESWTIHFSTPMENRAYVPCAGEDVAFKGTLFETLHFTIDDNGEIHAHTTATPQDVSGLGVLSGDLYHWVGTNHEVYSTNEQGTSIFNIQNSYRLIGQGSGNNFQVIQTAHATVNANGETTVDVVDTRIVCD